MDYIREELLRQRTILSVLMGGGQSKEQEEPETTGDGMLSGGQTGADARGQILAAWETETLRPLHGRSGSTAIPAAERVGVAVFGDREAVRRRQVFSAEEEPAAPVYAVRYERTAPEADTGAKEFSRSIQRDARRYDGGFSIY